MAADEAEGAAFAGELDGDAHEGGDAGTVDLGDTVEDDDDVFGAGFDDGFESVVELLGGLADGEAAVNLEHRDAGDVADVDFHGEAISHQSWSNEPHRASRSTGCAAGHYTLAGKLHKVC
jgi:hypothetical protein